MRDEERIELYYKCNTLDWKSEEALAQESGSKGYIIQNKLSSFFHMLSVFFDHLSVLTHKSKVN